MSRRRRRAPAVALVSAVALSLSLAPRVASDAEAGGARVSAAIDPAAGIGNIDHVVVRSELDRPVAWWTQPEGASAPYAWADSTWLLDERGVSWAYYVGANSCRSWPCDATKDKESTNPLFNPLPGFRTVHRQGSMGKIRPHADYFSAAAAGTLPQVSWLMPTAGRTEHPPDDIGNGQAWVTRAVNAIMQAPSSSASTRRSSSLRTTGEGSTTTCGRSASTRTGTGSACPAS